MDDLPASGLRDIRDLQRGVAQAQQSAATGRPLTEASRGWILRAMATPDLDELGPDDVWIRAEGGQLWALSHNGDVPLVEFVRGAAVATPAFPLTNSASTYIQANAQTVVNTVDNHHTAILAILASLRNAGIIAT